MERINSIKKLIKKWQAILNLNDWILNAKLVDFKRPDYPQSGDIKVDLKNKKAIILLSNNPRLSDEKIVVHELVHLLLWEYDHFCENSIPAGKKDKYFDLLEKTAAKLTRILLQNENN